MESSSTSPLINAECTKGGWRSSIYLIVFQAAERIAFTGESGNLITYLTNELHEPMANAAQNFNVLAGVTTLLSLLGGFVADAYLGGFYAILIFSSVYVLGLVMLTGSAMIPIEFRHVPFFMSLYIVAIGQGACQPCVQTFGAHQFDDSNEQERKAKSAFFNWLYFGACSGGLAAMLIIFTVQDNVGWVLGFAIPALALAFGLVIFLVGGRSYRQYDPSGSPLTQVVQVLVAAFRKRHVFASNDVYDYACEADEDNVMQVSLKGRNLPRTNQFKCLDRGTFIDEIDALSQSRNNWRLCSVTQVEEVKLLLRLVPIWFSSLPYTVIFAQACTFFTKQGSTMDTYIACNFHISPASLQISSSLVILLFLPIYDRCLIPFARTFTKHPSGITMLQRIGFGMFLATVEMVVAALVESRRVNIATDHGLLDQPNKTVPMSVWWLLPQYVIYGVSSAFTVVGLQELFYDQMPDKMRSIGSATYVSAFGVGSFLSSMVISSVQFVTSRSGDKWLVDNVNRAHLNYYYWFLAALNGCGLGVFVIVSMCFTYKK